MVLAANAGFGSCFVGPGVCCLGSASGSRTKVFRAKINEHLRQTIGLGGTGFRCGSNGLRGGKVAVYTAPLSAAFPLFFFNVGTSSTVDHRLAMCKVCRASGRGCGFDYHAI